MSQIVLKILSGVASLLFVPAVFGGTIAGSGVQNGDVGFVLDVSGAWFLKGDKQPIRKGRAVPVAGEIEVGASSRRSGQIKIVLFNGGLIHRSCMQPGVCAGPLKLPNMIEKEQSIFDRVWNVYQRIVKRPDRFSFTGSRGSGELQDAVITIGQKSLDLKPVMEEMVAGKYELVFRRLAISDQSATNNAGDEIRTTVILAGDKNAFAQVPQLRTGLYGLECPRCEQSDEAWALFVPQNDFERARSDYQSAVGLTQKWDVKVRASAARNFLRAYLEYLSLEFSSDRTPGRK